MKQYSESARSRAMKELEVILKAMSGEIKWVQAADICGLSARQMRRKHSALKERGVDGLLDQRCRRPSPRRAPCEVVERVLLLYREQYFDFNVKHFHEHLVSDHEFDYSYSWTKNLLQEAGYVKPGRSRGVHRKRRERRKLFGQMLHLDGSDHEWLALCPGERQVLLLVVDDATSKNLSGRLASGETTRDCLSLMREVVEHHGIPMSLYTDRGSVYWLTSEAGGKVDKERLTQFGRAMEQLGVEMIPGYSPQARGRSERMNGTWQGRLVAELRRAGIDKIEEANRYISDFFLPQINRNFSVDPEERGSAFVGLHGADLERIFSIHQGSRKVGNDNTIKVNNLVLQIEKSRYRDHFVRCKVEVFEHLEGGYIVMWDNHIIGRYDCEGRCLNEQSGGQPPDPRSLSLSRPGKEGKKKRRKRQASAPSPVIPQALGSVSTGALPSLGTKR